jgi:hydroxyacylglutathione hydrolase
MSLRGCLLSQQRVCQLTLDRGGATRARGARWPDFPPHAGAPTSADCVGRIVVGRHGKLEIVFITGFPAGLLQCNCYVLAPHPGADAIVIDPGQRAMGQLRRILDKNRLTPAAVLLTHGHIDHIWSAQKVSDTFGCPAYIHPEDRCMLTEPIKDLGPRLGQLLLAAIFREPKQVIELDRDGDKIDLGGISVTVDHTPGHTRGSVVFRVADAGDDKDDKYLVFTGDTLFERSVGRTDLFGGSGRDLIRSIVDKLLVLDDKTVVLPGHGNSTTIGAERRFNPFLEGLSP